MKSHELLDMIGDVREDYVLAAGRAEAKRPRARWKGWAACAACAALVLCGWSVWRAGRTQDLLSGETAADTGAVEALEPEQAGTPVLVRRPGLHEYTLTEGAGGGIQATAADEAPAPRAYSAESDAVKPAYNGQGGDVPVQFGARLYENLYRNAALENPPEWYAGAWINDHDGLTVAVVEGRRNSAIESQVRDWAGAVDADELEFVDANYSQNDLDGLMDEISHIFDQYGWVSSVFSVDVMENRIRLEFFEMPSDEVLAALDQLDPDGGAIFIQVFTGRQILPTDMPADG